jgi:prepilin-type N-terminal cleavage/methylation domain-containing protein
MNAPVFPGLKRAAAFTLIELLVSMALLVLLVAAVSQMVDSTSAVISRNRTHMESDNQARLVFDRMAGDFRRMVDRRDVDYFFAKEPGNDRMFFYSEAPAFFSGEQASTDADSVGLIGYRINSNYQLERLGKQLSWTGIPAGTTAGSTVFLSSPVQGSRLGEVWSGLLSAASTDADYHVISDHVCRMEFCFQKDNGEYTFGAPITQSLADYSAIVVTLVILDPRFRQIADTATAAAAFADPAPAELSGTTPLLMASKWNAQLNAGLAGIPPAASSQIRIYQRHFYLPRKTSK